MFSAVGWACVEEAGSRDEFGDERFEPTSKTLEAVRRAIERLVPGPHFVPAPDGKPFGPQSWPEALFRADNGTWTVHIDTHRNHRQEWPMELFQEIGGIAAGSFGFLHVWDDEQPQEAEKVMRWSMVLGTVTVEEDVALRPVAQRWFGPHRD